MVDRMLESGMLRQLAQLSKGTLKVSCSSAERTSSLSQCLKHMRVDRRLGGKPAQLDLAAAQAGLQVAAVLLPTAVLRGGDAALVIRAARLLILNCGRVRPVKSSVSPYTLRSLGS